MKSKAMMTEVRVKDEGVVILPRGELAQLFREEQVEAVYKYGAFDREVQGEEKAVHDLTKGPYKGYDSSRPRASSVISSENVDRDGDIIRSGGMVISDAYMKGPHVLPMHSREFPVGMTRKIKQMAKSIWAEWEWLIDQEYTQASVFQQAWEAYVLNSTSVGFMPLEMENIPDSYGVDFASWELLEYSPVVIPANADAMRTDGLKTLLKAFGEAVMDGPSPIARRLWEEALAKVAPKQVTANGFLQTEPVSMPTNNTTIYSPKLEFGDRVLPTDMSMRYIPATKETEVGVYVPILSDKTKGVIPYKKTTKAPEDEAWDGPKEVAAAEISDLRIMATWMNSEEPDVKGSYKLPHHKADGHAVVWNGVHAAMGALMGARAPLAVPDDDRKGIYGHLSKHYAEFNKEPPDFKSADPATIEQVLFAFTVGTITRDETQEKIEELFREAKKAVEEKARQYKREAEDLAARLIKAEVV